MIVRFFIRKECIFWKSENKLYFFLLWMKVRRVGGGVYGGCQFYDLCICVWSGYVCVNLFKDWCEFDEVLGYF